MRKRENSEGFFGFKRQPWLLNPEVSAEQNTPTSGKRLPPPLGLQRGIQEGTALRQTNSHRL